MDAGFTPNLFPFFLLCLCVCRLHLNVYRTIRLDYCQSQTWPYYSEIVYRKEIMQLAMVEHLV